MTTEKKDKLAIPKNTMDNREIMARTIVRDISVRDLREIVIESLMQKYNTSSRKFLEDYWEYFEETGGHCPFELNSG